MSASQKVGPRATAHFLPEHLHRPYYDPLFFEQQSANWSRAILTILRFEYNDVVEREVYSMASTPHVTRKD